MKRYILAVTLLFVSSVIWGACVTNVNIANAGTTCISGIGAPTAYLWIQGLYNSGDGAGTDSTGVASVGTCVFDGNCVLEDAAACAGGAAGDYYIYADWIQLPFDGCPGVTGTERAVLLAYDAAGNYVIESRLRSEDWANWDAIGTIAAAPCAIATGAASMSVPGVPTAVDITWDNAAAGLYGSYNGAPPVSRVLTTFDVWFYQGVAPPASFVVPGAGWTAGLTGIATSQATTTGMAVPYTAGQFTYVTRRFYAEGIALPTASSSYTVVANPSGAPTISSMNADKEGLETNVTFTSADESKVTGFQVFWAPMGSDFTAIGNRIDPAGNNHTYTQSVRIPATGSYQVKVGAYLVDGNIDYSSMTTVDATDVIINRVRTNPI